jgi:hypothetical protein
LDLLFKIKRFILILKANKKLKIKDQKLYMNDYISNKLLLFKRNILIIIAKNILKIINLHKKIKIKWFKI